MGLGLPFSAVARSAHTVPIISLQPCLDELKHGHRTDGIRSAGKALQNSAGDRFRFEHFDGISEVYNPTGTLKPSDYRLPTKDASVDMTICASLFTHLLEEDCKHYLTEIRRVSAPGGLSLISIHNNPPRRREICG